MRWVALAAALVMLTGCVSDATTGGESSSTPSQTPSSSPTTPDSTPQNSAEDTPEPEPEAASPALCGDTTFEGAQETIRNQQRAFAANDFATALTFSSKSFRSNVTLDSFAGIITGSYAFLLDDPAVDFLECQSDGESALMRVEVAGSPIMVMVYRLVLEDDAWFIDAASIAGSREAVAA